MKNNEHIFVHPLKVQTTLLKISLSCSMKKIFTVWNPEYFTHYFILLAQVTHGNCIHSHGFADYTVCAPLTDTVS